MIPYYSDAAVTLYCADAREVLPSMPRVDAVITDPPYAETNLAWDVWPEGWPALVAPLSDCLWSFGSLRMFLDRRDEFAVDWRLAQDLVWEKHNGSNMAADRFRRVHELAVQWYRGDWPSLYKSPQFTHDATARQVRRKKRPPQWGEIGESTYESTYVSENGGPRRMRSVIYARGAHGTAVNETQKPESFVSSIVAYSVPPGGLVLDPFAGSGTTLAAARNSGRRAIGTEIRREQCEQIVERLRQQPLALSAPYHHQPTRGDR